MGGRQQGPAQRRQQGVNDGEPAEPLAPQPPGELLGCQQRGGRWTPTGVTTRVRQHEGRGSQQQRAGDHQARQNRIPAAAERRPQRPRDQDQTNHRQDLVDSRVGQPTPSVPDLASSQDQRGRRAVNGAARRDRDAPQVRPPVAATTVTASARKGRRSDRRHQTSRDRLWLENARGELTLRRHPCTPQVHLQVACRPSRIVGKNEAVPLPRTKQGVPS